MLDSAEAEAIFDGLYSEAILNPDELEKKVTSFLELIRSQAREARENLFLRAGSQSFDPTWTQQLLDHRVEYWTEVMTSAYIKAHGGLAEQRERMWNLVWPDGETQKGVVFEAKDADSAPSVKRMSIRDTRIRRLMMELQPFVPGQPVPVARVAGLTEEVSGVWALWRVAIHTQDGSWQKERIMPLFLHEDGRCLLPTARYLWEQFLAGNTGGLEGYLSDFSDIAVTYDSLREAAERQGRMIYEELVRAHREFLNREREKGKYRRRSVMRHGLATVRVHRLARLEAEEKDGFTGLREAEIVPQLVPLLVVRVKGRSA